MADTKHTNGPWMAASGASSIVGWPVVAQSGRLICSMAIPPKDINRVGKEQERYAEFMAEVGSNARLIAAAPDMLAALLAQEELASLRFEGEPEAAIARVREIRRAAIARAVQLASHTETLEHAHQGDWSEKFELEANLSSGLCSDCPPEGYPTDRTRCLSCPRNASVPA